VEDYHSSHGLKDVLQRIRPVHTLCASLCSRVTGSGHPFSLLAVCVQPTPASIPASLCRVFLQRPRQDQQTLCGLRQFQRSEGAGASAGTLCKATDGTRFGWVRVGGLLGRVMQRRLTSSPQPAVLQLPSRQDLPLSVVRFPAALQILTVRNRSPHAPETLSFGCIMHNALQIPACASCSLFLQAAAITLPPVFLPFRPPCLRPPCPFFASRCSLFSFASHSNGQHSAHSPCRMIEKNAIFLQAPSPPISCHFFSTTHTRQPK
jgi:hypothetical protein